MGRWNGYFWRALCLLTRRGSLLRFGEWLGRRSVGNSGELWADGLLFLLVYWAIALCILVAALIVLKCRT